jgi:hypothetical protein
MSKNRHTDTGKFMKGESTGVYRGKMKHNSAAVEAFKDALHTTPSRKPVCAHDGPSVNTDTLADISSRGATDFGAGKSNA